MFDPEKEYFQCNKCGKIFSGELYQVGMANIEYTVGNDEDDKTSRLKQVFFCKRCFNKLSRKDLKNEETGKFFRNSQPLSTF
jgi:hypothetical protein